MAPPSPSPIPTTTSANLLHPRHPRQNPQQPQLCPSPTTAFGPLGPTPTTTYLPCHNPQPTKPPCSGLSKGGVVALTVTIPLVLTYVAFIACAAAYYWGNNSNYNSGYDDGKEKGRREVEREVERKRKEHEGEVERRREEQERERERQKIWEEWRRRRGAEAAARNAAAANNRPATINAIAARDAFRTHHQADEPVRGRTDSSSRPQPEGRTPGNPYWTTPLQYHPTTAHQAPTTKNHRKSPTSAPTWPTHPPPSRRSASTSKSQNPRPSRNAVPLFLASRHSCGPSHGPSRKARAASIPRAQASTVERFGNATTRTFPQNQRFVIDEVRRSRRGSSSGSSRLEDTRAGNAGEAARGPVAAQRRDSSADGAEERGKERRRHGLEKVGLGVGGGGAGDDVNEILPRASPGSGFGAQSPSLRSRSALEKPLSPPGESPSSRSDLSSAAGRDGAWAAGSDRASAGGIRERRQGGEEREMGFPEEEGRSPRSRSVSPRVERSSPREESPSPSRSDGASAAGGGEERQDEAEWEPESSSGGRRPGSEGGGVGEGRSSRSRSPSPGIYRASAAGSGDRGRGEEAREEGVQDEGRWPGSEGNRDEEGRSKSPSPDVGIRDV